MPHNSAGGDDEFHTLSMVLARLEHELRSPLHAASGFARLLRDRLSDEHRGLVEALCAAIDQIAALVDDLNPATDVAAAALSAGTVGDAVGRALILVGEQAGAGEVAVVVSGGPLDVSAPATLGVGRLTQVLVNLLTNAIRHSPPGSQVTLEVRQVGGQWDITVTDRGPGVLPADAQRIFEPFVRSGPRPGTGLGLAIARSMVEAAGGSLELVATPPGVGASFQVLLPGISPAT
jgi:two-component system sensor histidine kinase KdpD